MNTTQEPLAPASGPLPGPARVVRAPADDEPAPSPKTARLRATKAPPKPVDTVEAWRQSHRDLYPSGNPKISAETLNSIAARQGVELVTKDELERLHALKERWDVLTAAVLEHDHDAVRREIKRQRTVETEDVLAGVTIGQTREVLEHRFSVARSVLKRERKAVTAEAIAIWAGAAKRIAAAARDFTDTLLATEKEEAETFGVGFNPSGILRAAAWVGGELERTFTTQYTPGISSISPAQPLFGILKTL